MLENESFSKHDMKVNIDHPVYNQIDRWFEEHKEEYIKDLLQIVRHKSISVPGEDGYVYGKGCKQALDDMLEMARQYGFKTHNFEDRVGVILYDNEGRADEDALPFMNFSKMIGIWNHLDVVPAGEGWNYEPFNPTRIGDIIIARGIDDNKAPLVGMLYMLRCFRDLKLPLKWQIALFEGCDEERGMTDLDYYTSKYPCPALSMVADCGFPVCIGEKGLMEGKLTFKEAFSKDIMFIHGGTSSNTIPDRAEALIKYSDALYHKCTEMVLKNKKDGESCEVELVESEGKRAIRIIAKGISKHSAFPQGSINAINVLCSFFKDIDVLCIGDLEKFSELYRLTKDYTGACVGISYSDEISGDTICSGTMLEYNSGRASLTLNIRYAITADRKAYYKCLESFDSELFEWKLEKDLAPNYFPKEHPAVGLLTGTYNSIMKLDRKPYVISAGTYARKLPHAFPYGIGGIMRTEEEKKQVRTLFKEGYGSYHQPDEHSNMRVVLQGMKIYAYSLYAMNELEEL